LTPRSPKRAVGAQAASTMHPWSPEALLAKAQLYAQEMLTHGQDDWRFGFWSALALELLARAALGQVSPTLLAEPREWENHVYALGLNPKKSRFVPKSRDMNVLASILQEVVHNFDKTHADFVVAHMAKRNEELHSSTSPFANVASSTWLPTYYESCEKLLTSLGSSLKTFFGEEQARSATTMIAAAKDKSAKSVVKAIKTHTLAWNVKSKQDRDKAAAQAAVWATRHDGHRVTCPSCGSTAIVVGAPISAPSKSLKDEQIVEVQDHLPSLFECIACSLKIAGLPQLHAAGLGNAYTKTRYFDPSDYYAEDVLAGFEDDNNER
jgi:hypothetical protein